LKETTMTTTKVSMLLAMAVLATASLNATVMAQRTGSPATRYSKVIVRRTEVPNQAQKVAGVISFPDACKLMAPYKQWMIGANSTGFLYPKSSWNGPASKSYNLKGLVLRKFLQYEKQGAGRGINIGWTDDASASTATKRAKWFFSRKSNSTKPIVYGEPLSLAWGNSKNSFVKYSHRTVGANLDWSNSPSQEWAILGGTPGQPVQRGKDWVIIYNLKNKQPLIYFDRTVGGDIGWPDSKTWEDQAWAKLKKHVTMENAATVMMLIASRL
jgi:hypothetical protein